MVLGILYVADKIRWHMILIYTRGAATDYTCTLVQVEMRVFAKLSQVWSIMIALDDERGDYAPGQVWLDLL